MPLFLFAGVKLWSVRTNNTEWVKGNDWKERTSLVLAWIALFVLWFGVLQGATTVEILSRF